MGCGASIDAGQIDRSALIPNRVPFLPTNDSPENGSRRTKVAAEKGRQGGVKNNSEAAPEAAERFKKGEATVALVLGPPGSGKTKQCLRTSREFGFTRLSLEEINRSKMIEPLDGREGPEIGKREAASKALDVTLRLLLETMRQSSVRRFLVDGYPCTVDQIQAFEAAVAPIDLVLILDHPEGISPERPQSKLLETGSGPSDDAQDLLPGQITVIADSEKRTLDHSFAALKEHFQGGSRSDVIVATFPASTSADDVCSQVAAFMREQKRRFVPSGGQSVAGKGGGGEERSGLARVDTGQLAEEETRWAAQIAAVNGASQSIPKEIEAEKFRKEYPWVIPINSLSEFCIRLSERYWACFDPELKEEETEAS